MAKNFAPKPHHDDPNNNRAQLVAVNDIEMYYEDFGKGEPLLLLHGFGGCSQNWQPFVDELAEQYRLIVVDLRGHGYSTNPRNIFTHRQAANDVFQLLEHLKIGQFSAMGMSTGGMVLLHMGTSQPQRIKSMVLISATTHFPEQARFIMKRASFGTMPQEVMDMYRECAKRGDGQIHQLIKQFNDFHNNYDDLNFSAEDLSAITARTLVIHGDRDNFFPSEIAENMSRAIPDASIWIIPNGDHVPIFDPVVPFTATALRFLR